jgi:hypothetical protein
MLLSTDWFLPHWSAIGLEVDAQRIVTFQLGCREVVKEFLSGALEYWHVSFSNERLRQTRAAFLALSQKAHVPIAVIERIEPLKAEVKKGRADRREYGPTYLALTELLKGGDPTQTQHLDRATKEVIRVTLSKYDVGETDFAKLCLASKSQWDSSVRELTPTQPTFLADYLVAEVLAVRTFDLFWSDLRKQLRSEQVNDLVKWYRETAKSLAGQDIDLPAPY